MTYRDLLTFATSIKPADHQTARQWLLEVATTLKDEKLTGHQRRYLYRLRRIWQERAAGRDARWEAVGCRAGAIKRPDYEIDRDAVLSGAVTGAAAQELAAKHDVDVCGEWDPVSHTERVNVPPEEVMPTADEKPTPALAVSATPGEVVKPPASPASKLSDILSRYEKG